MGRSGCLDVTTVSSTPRGPEFDSFFSGEPVVLKFVQSQMDLAALLQGSPFFSLAKSLSLKISLTRRSSTYPAD